MAGHGTPIYPVNKYRFDREELDALLTWGYQIGASDFQFLPNEAPWVRYHGQWYQPCSLVLSSTDIKEFLALSSRFPSAPAQVESGTDIDYGYEIRVSREERIRFRVNATGCRDGWEIGAAVVLRCIPSIPPRLEDLGVESKLMEACFPPYGLVLVTGPVGSGKSTLLASILRQIIETQPRNVITYEAPIEFDLTAISPRVGAVTQTEIPRALRGFELAPRNSLRRAGDVVLFGESRDRDTLRNMTIVAETGVAVYSTVHTSSVAETISRMIREFPYEERDGIAAAIISSLRLIVHQRLLRSVDGKRVAVREFLIFDDVIRERLFSVDTIHLIPEMRKIVYDAGQPLIMAVEREYQKGTISSQTAEEMRFLIKKSETFNQ
jgi:defect-in-organelle-trafficking protein DotB